MYCGHCGHEIPKGAGFCPSCGNPVRGSEQKATTHREKRTASDGLLERCNQLGKHLVPAGLAKRFPSVMPVMFIGLYAGVLIAVIAAVSVVSGGFGHDLSGTYRTSEFFPVNAITFRKDGSFTAVSYAGGTETYQGKYSKKFSGGYALRFTGGSASSGNPVTQYEASTVGDQYELAVEKINENAVKVQVIPKIGYYAWGGTEVYFYKSY